MASRRATLIALVLCPALVWLAFFTPPAITAGPDYLELHSLYKQYYVHALRAHRLPLWNPHVGLGRPFLADVETAALYPPSLLYLALGETWGLLANLVLHAGIALLGTLGLGRRLGMERGLAVIVGLSFAFSGPLVARLDRGQIQFVLATDYLPLILWLTLRLRDRPSPAAAAGLALALGLQFLCGHPQAAWITWLGLTSMIVGCRLARPVWANLRRLSVELAWLCGTFAWACLVSAVQLLPFLELAHQGNRSAPSLGFAASFAMPWRAWASLFGGPSVPVLWEDNVYIGLLGASGGLLGFVALRGREARSLRLLAVAGLVLSVGQGTPLFAVAYRIIPGLSSFRLPSRAAILTALSLLLMMGMVLSEGFRLARRRFHYASSAVVALLLAASIAAFRCSWPSLGLRLAVLAVLVGAMAVWVGREPWPDRARVKAWLGLVTIALLDLGLAAHYWKFLYGPLTTASGESLLRDALTRKDVRQAAGVAPPRVSVPLTVARQNAGMSIGYSTYAGYVALSLARVWTYSHEVLGIPAPERANTFPSPEIHRHGPFPFDTMSLVLGSDEAGRAIVSRADPDPRAWVAPRWRTVSSWREALSMIRAGHEVHREPLLEGRVPPMAATAGESTMATARIVSFDPERVIVRTDSRAGGLLVLGEAWYPGWRARVGSRDEPCLAANVWMRAVRVPPGRAEVVFYYRSSWLVLGCLLSATSLGLALLVLWRAARGPSELTQP